MNLDVTTLQKRIQSLLFFSDNTEVNGFYNKFGIWEIEIKNNNDYKLIKPEVDKDGNLINDDNYTYELTFVWDSINKLFKNNKNILDMITKLYEEFNY